MRGTYLCRGIKFDKVNNPTNPRSPMNCNHTHVHTHARTLPRLIKIKWWKINDIYSTIMIATNVLKIAIGRRKDKLHTKRQHKNSMNFKLEKQKSVFQVFLYNYLSYIQVLSLYLSTYCSISCLSSL